MADTIRSRSELLTLFADNTTGDISPQDLRDGVVSWFNPQGWCQGRLTLESGVPVSTTDQTAKTNVFFTPFNGNRVAVFDGTSWKLFSFPELTLALGTVTSGLPYDVFLFDNAGTLTLEKLAWTNGTTRATALTTQDGVYVKTGATTRLYLGTFYTTSTTTTEDSGTKRYLWSQYGQVYKFLSSYSFTGHTYTTATLREWNAGTDSVRLSVVVGAASFLYGANIQGLVLNSGELSYGLNTVADYATPARNTTASNITINTGTYAVGVAAGFNQLIAQEKGSGSVGTFTNYIINATVLC